MTHSAIPIPSLFLLALALSCSSAPPEGKSSQPGSSAGQAGTSGSNATAGGALAGGGAGAGGAALNTNAGGATLGVAGGASGAGQSASAGAASACPDPQTPPADCPTMIYPDNVVIRSQADADALAGYTAIDGSLIVAQDGTTQRVLNLDALHCLQKTHFELSISRAIFLTSLDGLRELTEVGASVDVENNPLATLGCGLRKLSKMGTHGLASLDISYNPKIERIELPLLDSSAGQIRIESNQALQAIVGSPAITIVGQFFIRGNPMLTSVSGFTGLKTANEVRFTGNPMLPVCQLTDIVKGLSQATSIVDTSGNLEMACP